VLFSQTQILKKEVYLFERLDRMSNGEPMRYVKCIVFIRPTKENIDLLINELRYPKFGQYYICKYKRINLKFNVSLVLFFGHFTDFSNIISNSDIMALAESDEHESVREVQEFYADYLALSPHLFSLNIKNGCYRGNKWNLASLDRSIEGLISVLLSLTKYPKIRYDASSEMCKKLAEEVNNVINKENALFSEFNPLESSDSTTLLILDRKMDPYTPLLNQVIMHIVKQVFHF